MANPLQPRLRPVESFPANQADGEVLFIMRDPQGFAGTIALPYPAAVLASLMNGERTTAELQQEFRNRFGQPVASADLERLISQLDERYFLETPRFRANWKAEVESYLNSQVRPAAFAGKAYAGEAEPLRQQLDDVFRAPAGPGAPNEKPAGNGTAPLRGVLSPHIDLARGGPTFAWAYKKIFEESQADLFIIFGTAHTWMRSLFSISKKHFETPLGIVETDRAFMAALTRKLAPAPGGGDVNLFADELAHRHEHSIEFQVLFLQHLLGDRRPFKVVPILTGSFAQFIESGQQPAESPQVAAFVTALQQAVADCRGRVCYVSGGDLAHIGQRFGDPTLLTPARLEEQSLSDRQLLSAACNADAGEFFNLVAGQQDRHRICGLSPTYTMLEVMRPNRGELLKYDQAVEPDGTACVSFASLAFY